MATLGRTGANLAKASTGTLSAKILANAATAQSLKADLIQVPKADGGAPGSMNSPAAGGGVTGGLGSKLLANLENSGQT